MQKVFISYSWKDEAITLRLYRDLKRQNISVWLDRIDGEPTGDFQKEFLRLIEGCDCFIVVDSENYRHKSRWCETELEACFSRIDNGDKLSLIVCLLGENGDWRIPEAIADDKKRALFKQLNSQKYLHLSHTGTYDNDRVYESTVEEICKILGKDSCTWDTFPEEVDLIDELEATVKVSDDERESLKSLLKTIVLRRRQQLDITPHLQLLISNCEELGLKVFVPRWIYGIWLAENRHNGSHDQECLDCMLSLAEDFPHESRAFRGLGAIAARMGRQELAAQSFRKALEISVSESATIRYEILCNLGQVYMNLKQYSAAKETLGKALELLGDDGLNEQLQINYFECLCHLGSNAEARGFIKQVAQKNKTVPSLQNLCGLYHLSINQPSIGLGYVKRAYLLNPSLENTYGYLCGLRAYGSIQEYRYLLQQALEMPANTEEEIAWKKQIQELNNIL